MDPLSISVSVITLLVTAQKVIGGLEELRSRLNPAEELRMLLESVTDLQRTLRLIRDYADALNISESAFAQQSHKNLQPYIVKLQKLLDDLVDFVWNTLLKKGRGISRLSLSENKKKRLQERRASIIEVQRNLQLVLNFANLSQTPALFSAIDDTRLLMSSQGTEISAKLDLVIAGVTTRTIGGVEKSYLTGNNVETSMAPADSVSITNYANADRSLSTSHHVRITASAPRNQCQIACNCQCHVRTEIRTPHWLTAVVGTLFYASTHTPALDDRPCNSSKCLRSQPGSSSHFTYYFPAWMMRSAAVYSTWSNLGGTNSSWSVTMPREIPGNHICWYRINSGHEGEIRELLHRKMISPFDVDSDGISLLHYALARGKHEIGSLLVKAGADLHLKDRAGVSPIDKAWEQILLNRGRDQARDLIGWDDHHDLDLSPIHRVIIGLSSVDIRQQINLEPSRINAQDWTGKSPLMWAVRRHDHEAIKVLLSEHADVSLQDMRGLTALHIATNNSGCLVCISLLIDAKASVDVRTNVGLTPLHYAMAGTGLHLPSDVESLVTTFRDHHADLEARDFQGRTPLMVAALHNNSHGIRALAKFGVDINATDNEGYPTIVIAIYHQKHGAIDTLCQLGARLIWPMQDFGNSVLYAAAARGDVITMLILAASRGPLIDYDKDEIWSFYNKRYLYLGYVGTRYSPDVERAAFQNLLNEKGRPTNPTAARGFILDTVEANWEIDDRASDEHNDDEKGSEQGNDGDEEGRSKQENDDEENNQDTDDEGSVYVDAYAGSDHEEGDQGIHSEGYEQESGDLVGGCSDKCDNEARGSDQDSGGEESDYGIDGERVE